MEIEKIKLSELKLDLNNLRGHNEEEVHLLTRSLTIFGQYKPLIVDKATMEVKVGNGRLMAMRKLGWTECDCILLDWTDKKGLEVIDNRLNELSSWQDKDLKKWFKEKGNNWWGIDSIIKSKVDKMIVEKPKKENKEKEEILCPCCGKPLVKKKKIILD
jgi:hypothetical protein